MRYYSLTQAATEAPMHILHRVGKQVRVNSIMYALYILSVKPARRKAFERRLLRRIGGTC